MTTIAVGHCLEAPDDGVLGQRLCDTLRALPPGTLPLQAGCGQGGMIDDHAVATTVLGIVHTPGRTSARVGVFFTERVGGCNCNDDPLAVNAYCVIEVDIDRATGQARIAPGPG